MKNTRGQINDLKNISDALPDAFKTELMRTDQAQRQAEQQNLRLREMELDNELNRLQFDRNDALTTYALNLPADPNAPGWQSVSPQDVANLEGHVESLINDARATGQPTPELDRLADTLRDLRIDDQGGPIQTNDPAAGQNDAPSVHTDDSASVQSDNDVQDRTTAEGNQPPAAEPRPRPTPFMCRTRRHGPR